MDEERKRQRVGEERSALRSRRLILCEARGPKTNPSLPVRFSRWPAYLLHERQNIEGKYEIGCPVNSEVCLLLDRPVLLIESCLQ